MTTLGSLGDLFPFLAIGQELKRRGHHVTIGTLPRFQQPVEDAGLEFRHIRASATEEPTPDLIRAVFAGPSGPRFLVRRLLMPAIGTAWADTLAAAGRADLLIGHPLSFATPLVAQHLRLPWLSILLAPSGLLSAFDPPRLPGIAPFVNLRAPAPVFRLLFRLADLEIRRWLTPLRRLAGEHGLPYRGNPFRPSTQSPFGTLALFSGLVGSPPPDWPSNTTVTGFPVFRQAQAGPEPGLAKWMRAGVPPVVFTLGSSAVMDPGRFFAESAAAARLLRRRALLLGYAQNQPSTGGANQAAAAPASFFLDSDPTILAAPYARYGDIFPLAAATVHQGGIGTLAEALRAGKPTLVVPFGVDQPDNAARALRLGVARTLPRRRYRAARVAGELRQLLEDPRYRAAAERCQAALSSEDGAGAAANAVEAVLKGIRSPVAHS